jgi:hypothetical protein
VHCLRLQADGLKVTLEAASAKLTDEKRTLQTLLQVEALQLHQ